MAVAIIDVRSPVEFGICHLPGSISMVLTLTALFRRTLIKVIEDVPIVEFVADPTTRRLSHAERAVATVVVCRLGNDSQIAANALRDYVHKHSKPKSNSAREDEEHESTLHRIVDLVGGLRKWSEEADPSFPIY